MGYFNSKKKVTAVVPSGRVLYRFKALQDFWSDKFQTQYVVGGIYSVRQGNEKLAKFVSQWVASDKVEVL